MVQSAFSLESGAMVMVCQNQAPLQASLANGAWELTPCQGLSISEACRLPSCCMHVVRHGEFVGFKMEFAQSRLLQVCRRNQRLVLASDKFGVYEQMHILQVPPTSLT
jgi:hypothetical protein